MATYQAIQADLGGRTPEERSATLALE